ncbi:hypothetical protein AVEN_220704-1 [Araneus ventricosus]|uniref:Uncharacterized protein n=1 Tax=Araneus ventricosus TaxID=182803 RepID=A0A4Y2FKF3_ARAVE|nr:hypothetical protein AVEN_220704-1 [Araneus ventricosus]
MQQGFSTCNNLAFRNHCFPEQNTEENVNKMQTILFSSLKSKNKESVLDTICYDLFGKRRLNEHNHRIFTTPVQFVQQSSCVSNQSVIAEIHNSFFCTISGVFASLAFHLAKIIGPFFELLESIYYGRM